MTKLKLFWPSILAITMCSLALLFSPVSASDISSTSQVEETITVPLTTWNELKANDEKALNIINASSIPLTEAQDMLVKQANELNEAKTTIDKLKEELATAKADSMKQEATLNEMQNSIVELRAKIERDERTMKRLRMQRNLAQVTSLGAFIGVTIRR